MKLINRSSDGSSYERQACEAALARHVELYGEYGHQKTKRACTIVVHSSKDTVEVVNKKCSYLATPMNCARRLHHRPGQCN